MKININFTEAVLSEEKTKKFYDHSMERIQPQYKKYQEILHTGEPPENNDSYSCSMVINKFDLNDKRYYAASSTCYIERDSSLAGELSRELHCRILKSFNQNVTQSYCLQYQDIFPAIDRLELNEDYVIVTFGKLLNAHFCVCKITGLNKDDYKGIPIIQFEHLGSRSITFFVLKKSDLPVLMPRELPKEEVEKFQLQKFNSWVPLYMSVINLNESPELLQKYANEDRSVEDLRQKVLNVICLSTFLAWRNPIQLIQIQIVPHSNYRDQWIPHKLEDVKKHIE